MLFDISRLTFVFWVDDDWRLLFEVFFVVCWFLFRVVSNSFLLFVVCLLLFGRCCLLVVCRDLFVVLCV